MIAPHRLTRCLKEFAPSIPLQEAGQWGTLNDRVLEYVTLAGTDAWGAWQTIHQNLPGVHPVVMPHRLYDTQHFNRSTLPELADRRSTYQMLDVEQWWSDRWGTYDFDHEEDEADLLAEMGVDLAMLMPSSDLEPDPEPDPNPEPDLVLARDILTRDPLPQVWLVGFPEIPFWEIPIYLEYGGWNACPYPEHHAAVLAHWHKYYGVQLCSLDQTTLELWVPDPPVTYEAAHSLAKEQMAYCDDIVFQGTFTVARLAELLVKAPHWCFWWD